MTSPLIHSQTQGIALEIFLALLASGIWVGVAAARALRVLYLCITDHHYHLP